MSKKSTIEILKEDGKLSKKGTDFKIKPDTELIGVYFSAHWCPPCRGFTPVLAEFYKKWVEEEGKSLEIVFVSSDRDQEAFDEYYNSMPWAALKFEFRDEKETLCDINSIRGIPTLLIFDSQGNLKDGNGRARVTESQQSGSYKMEFTDK